MTRLPFASEGLTIVITAGGSPEALEATCRAARAQAIALVGTLETILVDDASTDGTSETADRLAGELPATRAFHCRTRLGPERAALAGARRARLPLVLAIPARAVPPAVDMAAYLEAARHAQIVLSGAPPIAGRQPVKRMLAWILENLAGLLLDGSFEATSGVVLYRREAARALAVRRSGAGFDVELLFRARQRGMCAVRLKPAGEGAERARSSFALAGGIVASFGLWREWRREARRGAGARNAGGPRPLRDFWWPRAAVRGASFGSAPSAGSVSLTPVSVHDALVPPWLEGKGDLLLALGDLREGTTGEAEVLATAGGQPVVVREAGRLRFLFDAEAAAALRLAEAQLDGGRPLAARIPPALLERLGPGLRRAILTPWFAWRGLPAGARYWPIDPSVEWLRWVTVVAGAENEARPPAPLWPGGKSWALVVTHQVETAASVERLPALAAIDAAHGIAAGWYAGGRVARERMGVFEALRAGGHEIGLLGDCFDPGLPWRPAVEIEARLTACEELIDALGIRGFRCPGLGVSPALREILGRLFVHDSSTLDCDLPGLQGPLRGCGSVFPIHGGGEHVRLPITLPPDDRLLGSGRLPRELLGIWRQKVEFIRRVGGMALLAVSAEPDLGGSPEFAPVYAEFLGSIASEPDVWKATPGQVADWWLERAGSVKRRAARPRRGVAGATAGAAASPGS